MAPRQILGFRAELAAKGALWLKGEKMEESGCGFKFTLPFQNVIYYFRGKFGGSQLVNEIF